MNPNNETDSLLEKIENLKKINQLLLISNEINSPDFFIKYKDIITRCCEECNVGNLRNVIYSTFDLNFEYDSSNYTAKISQSCNCKGHIIVPRSVYYKSHDYVITSIVNGFYQNDKVISLSFANDTEIRSISSYSFCCSSFKRIEIPSTVEELCDDWNGYIDMSVIHFAPNNPNYLWLNQNLLIKKSDKKSNIFDIAFLAWPNVEEIVFPANIKEIGKSLFKNMNLKKVLFAENSDLQIIGAESFYRTKIKEITIPSHVKIIDYSAFKECQIEKITIPRHITSIGQHAFHGNPLRIVEFSNDSELQIIGLNAFEQCLIEEIKIPSHVKEISGSAFCDCRKLRKISFTDDSELTEIGSHSFRSTVIEVFNLPSHVKKIGARAFSNCSNLRQFIIPINSELQELGWDVCMDTCFNNIKCIKDLLEMQHEYQP